MEGGTEVTMIALNRFYFLITALAIACLYGIAANIKLQDFADDLIFSHTLDNTSLYSYLISSYSTWSGRVTINALMVGTINHHNVWKIGIPVSVMILCLSVTRICVNRIDTKIILLAFFAYLALPKEILQNGSWWVTGFYNYLLPVSLMLYSSSVYFLPNKVGMVEKVLSVLALSLACFSEQASMIIIACSLMGLIFCKEIRSVYSYIYLFVALFFSGILFTAPGNYHRLEEETWRWMPGFDSESFLGKLIYGYDRIHEAIVMPGSFIFCALCVLCLILILRSNQMTKIGVLFSFILSLHIFMMTLIITGSFHPNESFYNPEYINPHRWIDISRYFSYSVTGLVIISICYALTVASLKDREFLKPLVMIVLGFASIAMVGLSPTVYASGMRVLYVWAVMIMCASIFIYCKLFGNDIVTTKNITALMAVAYILSLS
jgi:hypothetical protein